MNYYCFSNMLKFTPFSEIMMDSQMTYAAFFLSILSLLVTLYVMADTTRIRKFQNTNKEKRRTLVLDYTYETIWSLINNLDLFLNLSQDDDVVRPKINQNILFLYNRLKTDFILHINHFSDKQIIDLKKIFRIFDMGELNFKHETSTTVLPQEPALRNIINLLKKFVEVNYTKEQYLELIDFLKRFSQDKTPQDFEP